MLLEMVAVFVLFVALCVWRAADVYDFMIIHMTQKWYAAVLGQLAPGSRIVDIGIGTATALVRNADLCAKRDLKVVGVDYDQSYIDKANRVVKEAGMASSCQLHCKSLYDEDLPEMLTGGGQGKFTAAYFSGSFTLMPDPVKALEVAAGMVEPGGKIYITQTYQTRSTPFLGTLKPLLKYLTTIDFGQLVYVKDLDDILAKSEMEVLYKDKIPDSIDTRFQTALLVILQC